MAETQKETPEAAPIQEKAGEKRAESRLNRFLVRALRSLLIFLIILGLGMLLAIYAFYMPTRRSLNQARAENAQINQRLSEMESRLENVTALEQQKRELQAALDKADLHVAILSARADVAAAQLALAQNNPTKARLALSQTPDTLKKLADLLEPNQKKLASDMQERLSLAVKGIGGNNYAAASDLDVLMTSLMELENAYFTKP